MKVIQIRVEMFAKILAIILKPALPSVIALSQALLTELLLLLFLDLALIIMDTLQLAHRLRYPTIQINRLR